MSLTHLLDNESKLIRCNRKHFNTILISLAFVLSNNLSLIAQQKMNDLFEDKINVVFLGLDFSETRFVGKGSFESSELLQEKFVPSWNKLLLTEEEKYSVRKPLHLNKENYEISTEHHLALNNKDGFQQRIIDEEFQLSHDDLIYIVNQYNAKNKSSIGISFIVESFNRKTEEGSIWVTFIDLDKNQIIFADNIKAQSGGVGFRNYWAGSVFGVIEKIKSKYYKKWKETAQSSINEEYWQDKYKNTDKQLNFSSKLQKANAIQEANKQGVNSKAINPNQIESIVNSDSILIESIVNGTLDSSTSIEDTRFKSFLIFKKDPSKTKPLLALSILSEYLADYKLAANCYGELIKLLNATGQNKLIAKARAHQLTCNFLALSNNDSTAKTYSNSVGSFGLGLGYRIINGHLFVSKLIKGKNAGKSGLLVCDEIKKIDEIGLSDEWLSESSIEKKLKGNKETSIKFNVKRIGSTEPIDIIAEREIIDEPSLIVSQETNETSKSSIINRDLNENQKDKQNFITKIITTIQNDTVIMKTFAVAKKVTYALAILNKWASEPISSKFISQIDEQLGLVASLLNVIKGNNPNFSFDPTGKLNFQSPEIKELLSSDYVQATQSKFDSLASSTSISETKIDDNITFIETNNNDISGFYECVEMSGYRTSSFSPKKSYYSSDDCVYGKSTQTQYSKQEGSFQITQTGNSIVLETKSKMTTNAGTITRSNWINKGIIDGNIIKLKSSEFNIYPSNIIIPHSFPKNEIEILENGQIKWQTESITNLGNGTAFSTITYILKKK